MALTFGTPINDPTRLERRLALDGCGRQIWISPATVLPTAVPQGRRVPAKANPYRTPCGKIRIGPEDVS